MNKKLLALVGGAGVATGILLAPDKGSRTVKKLAGKGKKMLDSVKRSANGEITSVKKSLRAKVEDVKKAIRTRAKSAMKATLAVEEAAHRKVSNAIRTAGKAVGVEEKKTPNRNGAAKKSVRSAKPSRLKQALRQRSEQAPAKKNGARPGGKSSASAARKSSRTQMSNGKMSSHRTSAR